MRGDGNMGRATEFLVANPQPPELPPEERQLPKIPAVKGGESVDTPVPESQTQVMEAKAAELREELEILPDEDVQLLCEIVKDRGLANIDGRWGRENQIRALVACEASPSWLDTILPELPPPPPPGVV